MILQCNRALNKLKAKPFSLSAHQSSFLLRKFSSHLKLGQFSLAQKTSVDCLSKLEESTVNWFKFHQLYFIYFSLPYWPFLRHP